MNGTYEAVSSGSSNVGDLHSGIGQTPYRHQSTTFATLAVALMFSSCWTGRRAAGSNRMPVLEAAPSAVQLISCAYILGCDTEILGRAAALLLHQNTLKQ